MLYNRKDMKIIAAQGNPGKEYTYTRHNVGFLALDHFASLYSCSFIKKPKFHAEIGEVTTQNERVLLVKPSTFYNETGKTARLLIDFYKLNPVSDFLVIHDDLALPFGTIRTRSKGSDAGNNGIKSLNAHLGQNYARVRIGIYSEHRDRVNDTDFILGPFSDREKKALPEIFKQTEYFMNEFISGNFKPTKVTIVD
jgi:PTH1 family peptidyl-tRNA hydrolase